VDSCSKNGYLAVECAEIKQIISSINEQNEDLEGYWVVLSEIHPNSGKFGVEFGAEGGGIVIGLTIFGINELSQK
ncbi:hypothetical protein, partial [Xenorhabdus sp. TS4]|uniref:hypothetical protein n=1 Tax=Xenorhabdus sp. TS4 TaxID=1873483 RepID=UPI001CA454F4